MNMKRIISIVSVAAFVFPYVVPVFAQAEGQEQMEALKSDPKFYEVDPASIGVEYLGEVEEQNIDRSINEPVNSSAVEKEVASRGDTGQNALQITQMLNDIANIAKKAWKVVDDGRPVSNVHSLYATALPKGKRASQLQGWSKPRTHRYGFYVKNLYGIKTVEATYKVSYQYGGSLNGRGHYLTAVTVIPENVETMFGFNFNMSASVPDSTITNIGSSQNPVSALSLVLQWRISTILKRLPVHSNVLHNR